MRPLRLERGRIRSRFGYYLRSVYTILTGFRNPILPALSFFRFPIKKPFELVLRRCGLRFLVRDFMDVWIIKEVCLDGEYDLAFPSSQDDGVLIDVGAGIGEFAIRFAKAHPGWEIQVYEPHPESYALMVKNINLNQVDRVSCYPFAVLDKSGSCILREGKGGAVQATLYPKHEEAESKRLMHSTSIGFDEILTGIDSEKEIIVKMDCEGAEFEILPGADQKALNRVSQILVELHDGWVPCLSIDLKEFLSSHGFSVEQRRNPVSRRLDLLIARNRVGRSV